MKLRVCLLTFITAMVFCPVCNGAEGMEYLFRLSPEAAASAETHELDAESICAEEGVYVTGNYDLVRTLDRQGDLLYYEENGPVCLLDYTQDAQTLAAEDWPRAILGADYAVLKGNGGTGVRIGMIDSGVAADFADCTDAVIIPGVNYCAPPEQEEKDDIETPEISISGAVVNRAEGSLRMDTTDQVGHGTFAASLLVSRDIGLCPKAELVPLKCFEAKNGGRIDAIAEAIYDAVNVYHCNVINMSLGVTTDYKTLRDAVAYACEQGVILVAAAGNIQSGQPSVGNDPVFYPAGYDQVIGVGSLDECKQAAGHSSQNTSVWITAPGKGVKGLSMMTGTYVTGSGTSYAAPFVSAAAALARSAKATLSPTDFQVMLAKTAEDLGEAGRDNTYGNGMMNLGLLLAAVTKDKETMIPSYYNNTLCLSFWRPQSKNSLTWLARYQTDDRFCSLEELGGGGMNNLPVTEDAPVLLLMSVDRDTLQPLDPAIRYGGGDR